MRILLLGFFLSSAVSAQVYQGGVISVKSLRYSSDGVSVEFSPALTACQGGNQYRMHAKVPFSQVNSNAMTAALLTAYTAGQTIKYVWLSNEGQVCSSSHILNLDMIEMMPK